MHILLFRVILFNYTSPFPCLCNMCVIMKCSAIFLCPYPKKKFSRQ